MAQTTVRLSTTGMHCSSCSMLIDMTVGDLDGVESVKTDHALGETLAVYDADVVTVGAIISAIQSVGYEAEVAL